MVTSTDLMAPAPQRERHVAVEGLKLCMVQAAVELRIAATQLEDILRFAPDNDALREAVCKDFFNANLKLSNLVGGYVATRDIEGVG